VYDTTVLPCETSNPFQLPGTSTILYIESTKRSDVPAVILGVEVSKLIFFETRIHRIKDRNACTMNVEVRHKFNK
jgi:hypothetical protein